MDSQSLLTPQGRGRLGSSPARIPKWGWLLVLLASAPSLFWLTIGLAATLSSPSSQVTAPSPAAPVTTQSEPVPPPAARASTPTVDVAEPEAVIKTTTVKVTKIVDGDTIWVEMPDGTTEKVRFIGGDSPGPTNQEQPCG